MNAENVLPAYIFCMRLGVWEEAGRSASKTRLRSLFSSPDHLPNEGDVHHAQDHEIKVKNEYTGP